MGIETIRVEAGSARYPILLGEGLLGGCGAHIRDRAGGARALLVSDERVMGLYGKAVLASLEAAGYAVRAHAVPPGERSKCWESVQALCEVASDVGLTRADVVVALGGGVVGDLAGFFASVWLRGVPLVQLPTTLLAQIDSSVGGKVAIDVPQGKNLLGAFYHPRLVVCDTRALHTLDDTQFCCGLAEAIKAGAIADATLLRAIEGCAGRGGVMGRIGYVVRACLRIKCDAVAADPRDTGARMALNFGHTLGHAIEALSDYAVPHGQAVAAGMAMMARVGEARGITRPGTAAYLAGVLAAYALPTRSPYGAQALLPYVLRDKKAGEGYTTVVMLPDLGAARLVRVRAADVPDLVREACV